MNDKARNAGQPSYAQYAQSSHINHQAERAVISALVRKEDGRAILALGITPDLFTQGATREAFDAIRNLWAEGIQPDAATLNNAVSASTLIEIETSLGEHVSAANLPYWVTLLKACKREREIEAARQRLAQAAAAGAPDHELQAIVESIRQAGVNNGKASFVDVADLCALPPAENWLIRGYVATDSLIEVFGDPGCGKSFLAIDLACHVATGRDWCGCPVKTGKVLYIAGEGRNGLSKRLRAWFERYNEPMRNIKVRTVPIELTDPASIAALVEEIRAMPDPPDLIVIDTLNRNFGAGDENSTADMTRAVAGLDAIRNATGAAILVLHHSGHNEKGRGRGSSVLRAAVDTEFALEKFDATIQARCTKMKDADHPPPLAWTLEAQPLPWADRNGQPLNSAVLVPNESVPVAQPIKEKMGGQQRRALEVLQELYQRQRKNLEDDGREPDTARVSVADWMNAMKAISADSSYRAKLRKWLLEQGHIRIEGPFAYLVDGRR